MDETARSDDTLSLTALLQVLRKWFWVIALVIIVLTGTVVGVTLLETPRYEASINVLVGQESGISQTPQDAFALQNLTATIAEAANNRDVAEETIQRLDLQTTPSALLANVVAEPVPDTQFVQISYTDTDPERAQQVANTIGTVFSERITEVTETGPDTSAITVTVWEEAVVPAAPVSPDPLQRGFLALVLACALGLGLAFLLEYFDDRWQSPEEAEQVAGVPTFGVIPEFRPPRAKGKKAERQKDEHVDDES